MARERDAPRQGGDPRMIGDAGRGLIRFAEIAGLMDRVPEVKEGSATLIQLAAPSDGGAFSSKWNEAAEPAFDVSAQRLRLHHCRHIRKVEQSVGHASTTSN